MLGLRRLLVATAALVLCLGWRSLALAQVYQAEVDTVTRLTIVGINTFQIFSEHIRLTVDGPRQRQELDPAGLVMIIDRASRRQLLLRQQERIAEERLWDPAGLSFLDYQVADRLGQLGAQMMRSDVLGDQPVEVWQWTEPLPQGRVLTRRAYIAPALGRLAIRVETDVPLPFLANVVGTSQVSELRNVQVLDQSDDRIFQVPEDYTLFRERQVEPGSPEWMLRQPVLRGGPGFTGTLRSTGFISGLALLRAENLVEVRGNLRRVEQGGQVVITSLDTGATLAIDDQRRLARAGQEPEPLFLVALDELFPSLFALDGPPRLVQVGKGQALQGIEVQERSYQAAYRGQSLTIEELVAPEYGGVTLRTEARLMLAPLVGVMVVAEMQNIRTDVEPTLERFLVPMDYPIIVVDELPPGDPGRSQSVFVP